MIRSLHVTGIALIDEARLELGPGFTAITGETGAGKSLLVDSLQLALGRRADAELVRAGEKRGIVELMAEPPARLFGADELENGQITIRRELSAEGRSMAKINGRAATVAALREAGRRLADLHGQNEHQALLDPDLQLEALDLWIGDEREPVAHRVRAAYEARLEAQRRLEALRSSVRIRAQRLDMIRFQIEEIEAVSPRLGEAEELAAQLERLKHADRLRTLAAGALNALSEAEINAADLMGQGLGQVNEAARLDATLLPRAEALQEAAELLDDAAAELRAYLEDLSLDPDALNAAAERLDALKRLIRKYGADEADVLAHLDRIRQEADDLENAEAGEEALNTRLQEADAALRDACAELTRLRAARAAELQVQAVGHMRDLGMPKCELRLELRPAEPTAHGADSLVMLFSANPGEPLMPLEKVASGGELSRIMLSLKCSLAGKAGVPTIIFDEVDAGLSGRAAAATARKLAQLAQSVQVIAITHLPQIAGQADRHFRIEKAGEKGRTVTRITELRGEERVMEMARLLAGDEVGESALANARELLKRS
jgi:DNA repair protein RecN (Recombination protein N)